MGACLIELTSSGASMADAYRNAVEEAVYEHGNDSYNGTISTTVGCVDKTKDFKASGMTLSAYAEWLYEENKISKWGPAAGICLSEPVENTNKIKSQVFTNPQKGARVWKTMYVAQTPAGITIGKSEYQADAIRLARNYTEKHQEPSQVIITKELSNGSTLVSEIKYKKSTTEKNGRYYFIAIAAE